LEVTEIRMQYCLLRLAVIGDSTFINQIKMNGCEIGSPASLSHTGVRRIQAEELCTGLAIPLLL